MFETKQEKFIENIRDKEKAVVSNIATIQREIDNLNPLFISYVQEIRKYEKIDEDNVESVSRSLQNAIKALIEQVEEVKKALEYDKDLYKKVDRVIRRKSDFEKEYRLKVRKSTRNVRELDSKLISKANNIIKKLEDIKGKINGMTRTFHDFAKKGDTIGAFRTFENEIRSTNLITKLNEQADAIKELEEDVKKEMRLSNVVNQGIKETVDRPPIIIKFPEFSVPTKIILSSKTDRIFSRILKTDIKKIEDIKKFFEDFDLKTEKSIMHIENAIRNSLEKHTYLNTKDILKILRNESYNRQAHMFKTLSLDYIENWNIKEVIDVIYFAKLNVDSLQEIARLGNDSSKFMIQHLRTGKKVDYFKFLIHTIGMASKAARSGKNYDFGMILVNSVNNSP